MPEAGNQAHLGIMFPIDSSAVLLSFSKLHGRSFLRHHRRWDHVQVPTPPTARLGCSWRQPRKKAGLNLLKEETDLQRHHRTNPSPQ